jgi:hypothetical protein
VLRRPVLTESMPNQHVITRLAGIRNQLMAGHAASAPLSNASKGAEREAFVDNFLRKVFPPNNRFGTGDATDAWGRKSGQLDVVIEHPFGLTLPVLGAGDSRLYTAEAVAAVIEVKSDLAGQWDEVRRTAANLLPLRRNYSMIHSMGIPILPNIPFFAVGFEGWADVETLKRHVADTPGVFGALSIGPGHYVDSRGQAVDPSGAGPLWGLLGMLSLLVGSMVSAVPSVNSYLMEPPPEPQPSSVPPSSEG